MGLFGSDPEIFASARGCDVDSWRHAAEKETLLTMDISVQYYFFSNLKKKRTLSTLFLNIC